MPLKMILLSKAQAPNQFDIKPKTKGLQTQLKCVCRDAIDIENEIALTTILVFFPPGREICGWKNKMAAVTRKGMGGI